MRTSPTHRSVRSRNALQSSLTRSRLGGRFVDAAELVREYWAKQTTETISGARRYMATVAAALAARLLRPDLVAEIPADEMVELAFDSADN